MMTRVSISIARREFRKVIRAVRHGDRVMLQHHGKDVAAIVLPEDLAFLEAAENRHDVEEARRALAEIAEKGAIPWEDVVAEMDGPDDGGD